MKTKIRFFYLLPLIAFAIIVCILHLSTHNIDKFSIFITISCETALVFFACVSLLMRKWALPILNLRSDSYLVGTLLLAYSITNNIICLLLLSLPFIDIIRYLMVNNKKTMARSNNKKTLDVAELCILPLSVVAVLVYVMINFPKVDVVWLTVGAGLMLLLRLIVSIKCSEPENRQTWLISIVLIPSIIIMHRMISEKTLCLMCSALFVCALLSIIDAIKYGNIYGITAK